jgi:uncharacterized membrane protein
MTLPEIVLPKITLPFEMPILLHPAVDHFLIALPVVILLLEIMNLVMKKKAVGGVSFFLIVLTMLAAVGAYFTGLADGKEAFPALNEAAKAALGDHKLLGTYLMLASSALLLFKLLAMTGNKILKALYILVLIVFVALLLKQGKEGGELVYEHGINVAAVQALDDEIFDLKEELEEAQESTTVAVPEKIEKEVASTPEVVQEKQNISETTTEVLATPKEKEVISQSAPEVTGTEEKASEVTQSVATPTSEPEVAVTPATPETVKVISEEIPTPQ